METPNIFRFARGSALNTAIIGWILDFVSYGGELKGLGIEIIKKISRNEIQKIDNIQILSMYKNISLVIEINDDYLITIDDITFAKNQSNILKKRRDIISKDTKYLDRKKLFAYVHIGNKHEYGVGCDNCYVLSRDELLEMIKPYEEKNKELLGEYVDYLNFLNEFTLKYKTEQDFCNWHRLSWEGYFNEMQDSLNESDSKWETFTSKEGDSISFEWNRKSKKYKLSTGEEIEYFVYLMIETKLPCRYKYNYNENKPYLLFKVEVSETKYKSEIRNYVWNIINDIKDKYETDELFIEKTSHAIGTHMTLGRIEEIKTKEKLEACVEIAEKIISDLDKLI